jgi:hypothetical protein
MCIGDLLGWFSMVYLVRLGIKMIYLVVSHDMVMAQVFTEREMRDIVERMSEVCSFLTQKLDQIGICKGEDQEKEKWSLCKREMVMCIYIHT